MLDTSPDCRWDVVSLAPPTPAPARTASWHVHLRQPFENRLVGQIGTYGSVDDFRYQFADSGKRLLEQSKGRVQTWRTEPFEEDVRFNLQDDDSKLLISPDGRLLASSNGQRLEVLDMADGKRRVDMPLTQSQSMMAFGAEQATLGLLMDSNDGQARSLLAVRLARQRPTLRRADPPYTAEALEFNRSGNVLLTVVGQGFDIWDAQRGSFRHRFDEVVQSEFSPDGRLVALLSETGQVQVMPLEDPGRVQYSRPAETGTSGRAIQLALGSDDRTLVVLRNDGALEVHDLQRAAPPRRLSGQPGARVLALSPDLRWIATGNTRGAIVLHPLDSRQSAAGATLPATHMGEVARLAFSPDSRLLASGDEDDMVLVHALSPARLARRFDKLAIGRIEWLVFIENGAVLMAGNSRSARELWDLRTGLSLGRIGAGTGGIRTLELSPDASRLAVLRTDNQVELRDWNAQSLVRDTCALVGRNLDCDEWRQHVPGLPYRRLCPPPAEAPARCDR